MTIRLHHLALSPSADAWLRAPQDGISLFTTHTYDNVLLGMVRHIMRDEPCDIIPVVVAATAHPTNQYGHNVQVEVTYSRKGYRAIFAGHYTFETGLTNVQCYMD